MMQAHSSRERSRHVALTAMLAVVASMLVVAPPARAADHEDLLTDHMVAINETVSDAGFVHPGVGLSAADLRTTQEMVRSGQEPWASYFAAMSATGAASKTYRASNSKSANQPDVALDPNFTHVGLRNRETSDSFGALTQSLMWTVTGDEVHRRNAIQALRTWASMNPDGYRYFPDAHIHTGHPLYQFLLAAEIIRATEPRADDTPGTHDGYDVVWSSEDDERLLTNFANPVVETFLFSNERWMNQHNFGLFGRIATAIYADDAEGYATGVEWFTVNSTDTAYDNGSMAAQMPLIEADDPINPYGYDFVQVREMGRDQAHGETNIDNFAGLARMLEVQGTTVDPVDGTVSGADDAVSAYDFLGRRLLEGADQFYRFMQGAWIPWVDERGEGWNGTVSQAYRGRIYNTISVAELYYEYAIERGVDVEAEAPWLARLASRMDGPLYYNGTGAANFWGPGDKNPEYWVAFPEELAGTEPPPLPENATLHFDDRALLLDDGTEYVTKDGETFARASLSEAGTTSVMARMSYSGGAVVGLKYRSDGPANLEVLHNEEPSGLNPDEAPASTLAARELPDTGGEWRYIAYPAGGSNVNFYRLTGAEGTTVDLHSVILSGATDLTAPQFPQADTTLYLTANTEKAIDLSAADTGGNVTHAADGLPDSASLDAATGEFTWTPSSHDRGRHDVQIVADDGQTVAARTFELVVAKNRPKTIDVLLEDTYASEAVHTTVSHESFRSALRDAREASESGTDDEFVAAFEALRDAIEELELLNPRLPDGALDIKGEMVTGSGISASQVNTLVGDGHMGNLRHASFVLDFGARYRVAPERFAIQGPFAFGMRSAGTNVYGSNDGINWVLLTGRPTTETNDMETIAVVAEHRGKQFRYLKPQVDEPAPPIDPAYPGIWTLDEFHILGDRSEVPGTIDDVSLTSPDALRERVTAGDTAELAFSSAEPIGDVAVTIGGHEVEAVSEDGLSWTAGIEFGDAETVGDVPFTIDHTTADGDAAATVLGTTDFTGLYYSDEHNLVDVGTMAQVVDAAGTPDPGKAGHSASLFDGNVGSTADIGPVAGKYFLIWDFGQGVTIELDRIDFLARQNDPGMYQMEGLVFQGSNDLRNWTTLTEHTFKGYAWQNLESLDSSGFRYLRVTNGAHLTFAELRVFGGVRLDLDGVLERADAVDLDQYSRASRILFTREVEAIRAAAEEPDADRDALAERVLAAWDLFEDPPSNTLPVDQPWVTASSVSWDGRRDAAANGWAMFDGNLSTFTDTTESSGWVRVLPTEATSFTVDTVRFHPRSQHAGRAVGIQFQGSNDDGATWETFATIREAPSYSWNEINLDGTAEYGAVRVFAPAGFTNLAEVELVGRAIDVTGLDLYLTETEALEESDWTPETWADLAEAREAGLALRTDGASPSQEEVDAATDALAAAVAGLTRA